MIIDYLLAKRQMTKYRLAVDAGIPHATLNDICSGKTRLEKCSAETVYKLAKALDVPMETLTEDGILQTAYCKHSVKHPMSMVCLLIFSMTLTPIRKGSRTIAVCSTVFGVNCTEASTSPRSMTPVSHLNTQTISARNICMEALHHD